MAGKRGAVRTSRPVWLSLPEREHLLALLRWNEEEGAYYGNSEQYWSRHSRLRDKLTDAPPSYKEDPPRAHVQGCGFPRTTCICP